jgi:flagellar basal-body rod protein FlgC
MSAIDRLFGGMQIASSGLKAERMRIDVIAQNIANARTTSMPGTGGPYRRQVVHFAPLLQREKGGPLRVAGVEVSQISNDDKTPFEYINDPGHPHADAEGVVAYPNVNVTAEMADLITAVRAYEANLTVQENFMRMVERALRLAD